MKPAELLIKELKKKPEEELLSYLGDEEKLSKFISNYETIDENIAIDIIGDILSGKEDIIVNHKSKSKTSSYSKRKVSANSKIETTKVINETDSGFWSFDKMISGSLIKILYVLGIIVLVIRGIILINQGANSRYGGELLIFSGIGLITIGNVLWRIICEGMLLFLKFSKNSIRLRISYRFNGE